MKTFILAVVNLMTFIAAGNALECIECSNRNGNTCTEIKKTCPPEATACDHYLLEIKLGDEDVHFQVYKGCSTKSCHIHLYTETFKNVYDRVMHVCCTGDSCNEGVLTMPPKDNTPNGRKCPSCMEEDKVECTSTEIIDCVGDETGCFTFEGLCDFNGGGYVQLAAQGCANLEFCEPPLEYPVEVVADNHSMRCTKAPKPST